jgi:glycosyltransferase involved in cell wall biosynthesis
VAIVSLLLRPQSMVVSLAPLSVTLLKIYTFIAPWMLNRVVVNEDTYPSLYYSGGHAVGVSAEDIKKLYPKTRAVIGVSRGTYVDLKKNFQIPSPPLVYIPNWVSSVRTFSCDKKRRIIDVLYAGRLAKQKQPLLLARVFFQVLTMRPETVIHVYADGPMKSEFIGELVRLKIKQKVRLYNPVARMEHILRNTKCLLITSQFEGMPFIGLEAMACGAVMAGFDVPGVRDIVKDGETGVLAQNQEELSDHVIKLLNHTKIREDLARNARKRAESEFSENNRDTLIDLLLEHKI